eukprot:scaffold104529_cov48-Phaeocystis_antarctica.AAC.1
MPRGALSLPSCATSGSKEGAEGRGRRPRVAASKPGAQHACRRLPCGRPARFVAGPGLGWSDPPG